MNLIEVNDLHVRYGDFEAVKGVSFSLAKGEIFGIVGESGSGKSTIARTLIGLQKASSGRIEVKVTGEGEGEGEQRTGSSVRLRTSSSPNMQMIFQDAVGSLNPRMTVRQTLEEIIEFKNNQNNRMKAGGKHSDNSDHSIIRLLEIVGLSPAVLDQYPREMSGGQCQRVSIARALASNPEVLIADEPVSALDVSVQARILNLLRDLRRDLGLSIILIAHDLAVVKNVCDRIAVMEKGLFVDEGPAAEVFTSPKSAYTKRLLGAVPDVARALAARG